EDGIRDLIVTGVQTCALPILIISVRNLGYMKNAGEFVRRYFADAGSAGGHRAMAKAVVPMTAFRSKFGDLDGAAIGERLQALVRSEERRVGKECRGWRVTGPE